MRRLCHLSLPPLPGPLSQLPIPAVYLILLLILVNLAVWAAVAAPLHFHPALISTAVLSYTLGLRHALDADHIAAIDLATRRLIAEGQRPVAVGTFFSLGHSTVVIITCVIVGATAGAVRDKFDDFQRIGSLIGTSVSAAVLLLLCAANAWVMVRLTQRLRVALRQHASQLDQEVDQSPVADGQGIFDGVGWLSRVLRNVFKFVDRPWKMLPLGFLFGLGFDTSSEIALLGIASVSGAKGLSMWLILIFPALFTAGMCLLDTIDGALMMLLYTSKVFSGDRVAFLYYSLVLTGITVTVSAFIGIVQLLSVIYLAKGEPTGSGWDGLAQIGEHSEIIGGSVCGLFLVIGVGSVLIYKPWRRRALERHAIERVEDASSTGEQV